MLVLDRNRKWAPRFEKNAVGEGARDGHSRPFPFGWKRRRAGAANGGQNDGPKNLITSVIPSWLKVEISGGQANAKSADLGQVGDQLVRHAVSEIIL
jgi:hypothetical protein